MATIRDVAQLANVSVATVSNVLNNPEKVGPVLLARVRAAVDKLGYAPDAAARSLRKRSSGLLGMIVGDITNPFFSELFEAIELAAAARGFSVLLCNSNEITEREEAHLRTAALAAHRRPHPCADGNRIDEPRGLARRARNSGGAGRPRHGRARLRRRGAQQSPRRLRGDRPTRSAAATGASR